MNGDTIEVFFLHPLTSDPLAADISPQCTGQEALEELLADDGTGAFLSPAQAGRQYKLVLRHGEEGVNIPPKMTFEQAGVKDGDTVEVQVDGQGARRTRRKG